MRKRRGKERSSHLEAVDCWWWRDDLFVVQSHEQRILHVQRARQFITGTTAYKSDTIAHHEKSQVHQLAGKLHKYSDTLLCLNQQHTSKLRILFRNAHALAKYRKPFRDYSWLCELDEAKGLTLGNNYRSDKARRTFTNYVSQAQKTLAKNSVDKANFIAITSDGLTDSGISEQELVFLRFCSSSSKSLLHVTFRHKRSFKWHCNTIKTF